MKKVIVDTLCQKEIEYLKECVALGIEYCEHLTLECHKLGIKDTFNLDKKRLRLIRIRAKLKIALDRALGILPIKKKKEE